MYTNCWMRWYTFDLHVLSCVYLWSTTSDSWHSEHLWKCSRKQFIIRECWNIFHIGNRKPTVIRCRYIARTFLMRCVMKIVLHCRTVIACIFALEYRTLTCPPTLDIVYRCILESSTLLVFLISLKLLIYHYPLYFERQGSEIK